MKGGRHIKYDQPKPLANLHLTLLDKVGVRLDKFGDSTGKIDDVRTALGMRLKVRLSALRRYSSRTLYDDERGFL